MRLLVFLSCYTILIKCLIILMAVIEASLPGYRCPYSVKKVSGKKVSVKKVSVKKVSVKQVSAHGSLEQFVKSQPFRTKTFCVGITLFELLQNSYFTDSE